MTSEHPPSGRGAIVDPRHVALVREGAAGVDRFQFIVEKTRGKDVLDIGCVAHSLEAAEAGPWLHGEIRKSAKSLLGVDVLEAPIAALAAKGFEVVCGDVEALSLGRKFDVIVCGDVVEHVFNLAGFFRSLRGHLREGGVAIISTCNPFYVDQFLACLIKGFPLVNPSHVCWYDPFTFFHCADHFGFEVTEFCWLKDEFRLRDAITVTAEHPYDVFSQGWVGETLAQKVRRRVVQAAFGALSWPLRSLLKRRSLLHSSYLAVLAPLED
ncbi:MAG: methyltransferase domain-containing protein [Elusimicrobiota bacterium]|jgi:SAM-dependent methyltransferase